MSNPFVGVVRVICNSAKFLFANIKGVKITYKGMCTSRLSTEFSFAKGTEIFIGNHFTTMQNCRVLVRGGKLYIGDNVGINSNCIIACHDSITIGNGVGMGPNVCIYDHDHDFRVCGGKAAKQYKCSPVVIEDNAWIGANSIILRGVHIGKNAVIAAGSVVYQDVPENTVLTQKKKIFIRFSQKLI